MGTIKEKGETMTEDEKEFVRNIGDEYDWYRCVKCRAIGTAPINSFNLTVSSRDNVCLECINKRDKARSIEFKKGKSKKKSLVCVVCSKTFTAVTAKTCSKECREAYKEKRAFYRNMEKANREVRASNVHVFGQGKYAVSIYDKRITSAINKEID